MPTRGLYGSLPKVTAPLTRPCVRGPTNGRSALFLMIRTTRICGVGEIAAKVYTALDAMGIAYSAHVHPPIFTGDEAAQHWKDVPGVGIKNLFLRNKKGDRHYLVILD